VRLRSRTIAITDNGGDRDERRAERDDQRAERHAGADGSGHSDRRADATANLAASDRR
jgi:hypothetical protein